MGWRAIASRVVTLEKIAAGLAQGYRNARLFAEGLNEIDGLSVDMTAVHTNFVFFLDDGPCSAC